MITLKVTKNQGFNLNLKSTPFSLFRVKAIQSSEKRLNLIQYFKSQIGLNSLVFLQETLSTPKNENEWQDDFKGKIFYSHGKSNC